jgi:hypothetical protein
MLIKSMFIILLMVSAANGQSLSGRSSLPNNYVSKKAHFNTPQGNVVGREEYIGDSQIEYYGKKSELIGKAELPKKGSNIINYTDKFGSNAGRAEIRTNRIDYYPRGSATASHSEIVGNKAFLFDSKGKSLGRSEVHGTRTDFYNSSGKLIGSKSK